MNETEIIQHPQIDGLRIFFDTVDYRTPHVHEEFELIWLMEGRLSVQAGPFRHVAQSGEMVLFDPQQSHEVHKVEESCTFLCLQVAPTMLAGCFPAIRNIRTGGVCPGIYLSPDVFAQVQRGLLNVMRAYLERPACYELCCAGHVHLLMYRLLAAAPHVLLTAEENAERERRNARLLRLIRFVDQNYMHKIRLSDFARAERRSMSYLSHFVKEALGQSFQEYVNTVRFHCACKLIAAGQRRMLDVCVASGFSDYRYFSAAFQKRLGMTPEEYSRQPQSPVLDEMQVHHSLHSLERFYSREKSLELLDRFEAKYAPGV